MSRHRIPLRATRLVALVLKCAVKPITNRIITAAKKNTFFREKICVPAANYFEKFEQKFKLKLEGYNESLISYMPKMEDGKAIELIADIAGEALLLFLGVLILRFEKQRNINNTKELILSEHANEIEKLNALVELVEMHNIQIQELYAKINRPL